MSTALEKVADYSPIDLFLLSGLVGAGGFGSMRLMSDLHNSVSQPVPANNAIKLDLQNPYQPAHQHQHKKQLDELANEAELLKQVPQLKQAGDDEKVWNTFAPYMAVAGGLPLGFLGAKTIYDKVQENDLNAQVHAAKKRYAQQLALVQQQNLGKFAEETPAVDSLCTAMAEELEKSAGLKELLAKNLGKVKDAWGSGLKGKAAVVGVASATPLAAYGGFEGAKGLYNFQQGDPSATLNGANAPLPDGVTPAMARDLFPTTGQTASDIQSTLNKQQLHGVERAADYLSGGMTSAAGDLWKGVAGASTIGLLGLMIHNHNKKKEREQKANYPTTMEYAG